MAAAAKGRELPIAHTMKVFGALHAEGVESVLVMFSGGKDSIVVMDLCKKHFKNVVGVYMYMVPGMRHVTQMLNTARNHFKCEIIEFPHWALSDYIRYGTYQIESEKTNKAPRLKIADIENAAREKTGIEWVANGMRANDSMDRRIMLGTYEHKAIARKSRRFHPLSVWTTDAVAKYIQYNNLMRPLTYTTAAGKRVSGFDLTADTLSVIRQRWPDDYKKVIAQFPLADSQFFQETL